MNHAAEATAIIRRYIADNNTNATQLSLALRRGGSFISHALLPAPDGESKAYKVVLVMMDRINFGGEILQWARTERAKAKANSHRHRGATNDPDAHPWHGVRLYEIAAQPWRACA